MFTKTASFAFRLCSVLVLLTLLVSAVGVTPTHAAAYLIDISGPPNSGVFGETVTVLPNGNFVVTDPYYPFYTDYTEARGAVYLYSPNGVLISTLRGDRIGNSVGGGGITLLTSGDFVVNSPFWDSATTDGVGAVTWCSQVTGCNGFVSASNSLVGGNRADLVGFGGVTALTNGNYVVSSPHWNNGSIMWAGAVTWGNGAGGTKGVVSAANSLVGSSANDQVGNKNWIYPGGVMTLTNGNYLVLNSVWDNGSIVDAGAITWGNGTGGTVGVVSASNSLVGSSVNDNVGDDFWGSVVELTNGSYVVISPVWDLDATHADAGAITWGSGTSGVAGPISASNSLVGNCASPPLGPGASVTALTNGNYVVASPRWSPDGTNSAWGAATWGSGTTGVSGFISNSNSLVGNANNDSVGSGNFFAEGGVIALTNGNYVVTSENWNNQGAVTWGNGTSGISGPVSISNSLIGTPGEVIALANGNYAVSSPTWAYETPGPFNVGAVTWGNGVTGTTGTISVSNSLVGINTYDSVGDGGLVALTNGNFVAISTGNWSGLPSVTWVDGNHVTTGVISAANSLVGSTANDEVGGGGVRALTNGNYVVVSPNWDNGAVTDVGAITWGDGANGTTGVVSAANSLVGSTIDDQVGGDWSDGSVTVLTNGNYVVSIPQWDNGSSVDAGAVTWGNGMGGTTGVVSASNSLVGSTAGDEIGNGSFWGDVGVTALPNGNYIVNSPHWNSGTDAGAVTWGDGTSGTVGAVSASNSLVNTCANDLVFCKSKITALSDGNASMHFQSWSNGSSNGAISLISGLPNITVGPVSTANSVLGTAANKGFSMVSGYDAARTQLIVGRPSDNKVTILLSSATLVVFFVTRLDPTPTSAASVQYTVTFSEPVTGVDTAGPTFDDFSLTTSAGISGASVTAVSGSSTTYTVTVNTGSGNGTLRLDVVTGGNIVDADLNPLTVGFTTGQVYSVIKTATFADVPLSYWASSYIERLYIAGITGGCGASPLIYCPDATVTRAQMAIFLLRGMHGSAYTPPSVGGSTGFNDVAPTDFAAAWIKQLALEGITGGCGPSLYCPNATVTRAQMAIFLLRGEHGSGYTPPDVGASTGFNDVAPTDFAAAWIKQLAAEGITSGCGPSLYCPAGSVTRAEMAIFLVRAFSLP